MIIKINNVGDYVNYFRKTSDEKMLLVSGLVKPAREIFLEVGRGELTLPLILRDYRSMDRKHRDLCKIRVEVS